MSVRSLVAGAVSLVLIACLAVVTSFAEVVVDIGGTQKTDPTNVNIAGDYGPNCPTPSTMKAITITPRVAGSNARVEALSDSSIDNLKMSNVTITANCAVSNLRIAFGFNHAVAPTVVSPTQIRYKYYSSGYLSGSGASVKTKASYANNPQSPPSTSYYPSAVGSELTRTVSPFSTSGLTANLTNITNPRGLQAEFTLTLAAAGTLQMVQYYVQDYPAAGGGDGGSAAGAFWAEKTVLNILMSTASTSQALGCDLCVLADSSAPEAEKVKMFVINNMDNLSQDMASGRGQHLASLATLLNVPAPQQKAFFSQAQGQYAALAQQGTMTPEQLLATLEEAWNLAQQEQS